MLTTYLETYPHSSQNLQLTCSLKEDISGLTEAGAKRSYFRKGKLVSRDENTEEW